MLIRGTARQIPLADETVQCVVTSPPYWGLRDYGTASWEGGDPSCSHLRGVRASDKSKLNGGRGQLEYQKTETQPFIGDCGNCGAIRIDMQLGLEKTPQEYVENMVQVFREVRRVLKPDGTLWLNLGDSYHQGPKGNSGELRPSDKQASNAGSLAGRRGPGLAPNRSSHIEGLKPKDLVGIPWRVAFALQADGWWLRSDIIWAKPNPMPESVTSRPTKAHEYIFLLAKSERYYYDQAAVAEPVTASTIERIEQPNLQMQIGSDRVPGKTNGNMHAVVKWLKYGEDGEKERRPSSRMCRAAGWREHSPDGPTRNIRTVWTVATQPYSGAHFATFPEAIPERCIKAGSKPGDLILDPFAGTGTVGRVAERLNRRWVCMDLRYQDLASKRTTNVQKSLLESPINPAASGRGV